MINNVRAGHSSDTSGGDPIETRVFVVAKYDFFVDGILHILEKHEEVQIIACTESSETCWKAFTVAQPDVLLLHRDSMESQPRELIARVYDASPQTRLLIFGNKMSLSNLKELILAGASGYLNENMTGQHIVKAIRAVANGRLWAERILLEEMATEALEMRQLIEQSILERLSEVRSTLTPREATVLRHVLDGLATKQIADTMNISQQSVKLHLGNMFAKFSVTNRHQLILAAFAKICPVTNLVRLLRMGLESYRTNSNRERMANARGTQR